MEDSQLDMVQEAFFEGSVLPKPEAMGITFGAPCFE